MTIIRTHPIILTLTLFDNPPNTPTTNDHERTRPTDTQFRSLGPDDETETDIVASSPLLHFCAALSSSPLLLLTQIPLSHCYSSNSLSHLSSSKCARSHLNIPRPNPTPHLQILSKVELQPGYLLLECFDLRVLPLSRTLKTMLLQRCHVLHRAVLEPMGHWGEKIKD